MMSQMMWSHSQVASAFGPHLCWPSVGQDTANWMKPISCAMTQLCPKAHTVWLINILKTEIQNSILHIIYTLVQLTVTIPTYYVDEYLSQLCMVWDINPDSCRAGCNAWAYTKQHSGTLWWLASPQDPYVLPSWLSKCELECVLCT